MKKVKNALSQSAFHYMPKDEASLVVLRSRAQALAERSSEKIGDDHWVRFIQFQLGANEQYGIAYTYACEVLYQISPVKIPSTPSYISGVINRRGALIAVLDLKTVFNISGEKRGDFILVVETKAFTIGLIVDEIKGTDAYDPTSLQSPHLFEGTIKPDYIVGLHRSIPIIQLDAIIEMMVSGIQGEL